MNLIKAEVLLTRRCNLKCKSCKVIRKDKKEMDLKEWKKAFNIIYSDLGASFIALYGGEPLVLEEKKLLGIIEHLSGWRDRGKDFTIISNSLLATPKKLKKMIKAGLDSYTASIDTLSKKDELNMDNDAKAKSQEGLSTLLYLKDKIRDTCGIVTITKKNIDDVYNTIKFLSSHGIWAGIDVLHYDKGGCNFSSKKEIMKDLLITREDMPRMIKLADNILKNYNHLLVFPTKKIIQMWKNPKYVVDLNWKCSKPVCLTLECNGELLECDEFQGSRIKKYSIFDLPTKWLNLQKDYMNDVSMECKGCFWSTHVMACQERMLSGEGRNYYSHHKNEYIGD